MQKKRKTVGQYLRVQTMFNFQKRNSRCACQRKIGQDWKWCKKKTGSKVTSTCMSLIVNDCSAESKQLISIFSERN